MPLDRLAREGMKLIQPVLDAIRQTPAINDDPGMRDLRNPCR